MNVATFHTSFISIFLIEPFFVNNFFSLPQFYGVFLSERFSIFLSFLSLSLHTFDHFFLFFHFFLQFSWIFLPWHSLFFLSSISFIFVFFIGHSFSSFPYFSFVFAVFLFQHSFLSPLPSSLPFHLSILSFFQFHYFTPATKLARPNNQADVSGLITLRFVCFFSSTFSFHNIFERKKKSCDIFSWC